MWASRISTVALAFVVPGVLGAFADQRLGTSPAFVVLGVILGFAAGMVQILQIARTGSAN